MIIEYKEISRLNIEELNALGRLGWRPFISYFEPGIPGRQLTVPWTLGLAGRTPPPVGPGYSIEKLRNKQGGRVRSFFCPAASSWVCLGMRGEYDSL